MLGRLIECVVRLRQANPAVQSSSCMPDLVGVDSPAVNDCLVLGAPRVLLCTGMGFSRGWERDTRMCDLPLD